MSKMVGDPGLAGIRGLTSRGGKLDFMRLSRARVLARTDISRKCLREGERYRVRSRVLTQTPGPLFWRGLNVVADAATRKAGLRDGFITGAAVWVRRDSLGGLVRSLGRSFWRPGVDRFPFLDRDCGGFA
jgi:hypothetical protein